MPATTDDTREQINRLIDEANCLAMELLDQLDLTDAEREAAIDHAEVLIRTASRAMDDKPHLRERVITAAYAFALCWLEHVYQMTRPGKKKKKKKPAARGRRRKRR